MLSATPRTVRTGARRIVPRAAPIIAGRCPNPSSFHQHRTVNARSLATTRRLGYVATTNPNPPFDKKNMSNDVPARVALIGARGYTGQALIELLDKHPYMDLRHVSSRELAGQELEGYTKRKITYENLSVEQCAQLDVDAYVLALPNGVCKPYVDAIDEAEKDKGKKSVIVDLSADYRFDDTWTYALPEVTKRSKIAQSTRISNPGCFATAAQLAIVPIVDLIGATPTIMGISGYSGADSLTDHMHEREISHHTTDVAFIPHVSSWFRGIHLTINIPLNRKMTSRDIRTIYQDRYAGEKLVKIVGEPYVKTIQNKHSVEIGSFAIDRTGERVVICATIDNLNKGASTQCLQNMNLALGYAEYEGIPII
ncbi:n-acetyl-gamma-glutamyl-phosphate reductase [Trichoderma cornu-damae]|uniref:N-acetyl-gamma-glutamyl-phosphate reductase n=1 Tax=Trichoderma cornu-damae TaxID=654480 RepID=A0A9P8TTD6_9HYPO|nr:n-acetyl-gamma-glutamyl-phosphate reductase [Trichoderma cornu-damae]